MKKFVLAALAILQIASARAGDYLEPEPSAVAGDLFDFEVTYMDRVLSVLGVASPDSAVLKVVILPSFVPEEVTGLRNGPNGYTIFDAKPKVQLWGYSTLDMMKNRQINSRDQAGNDTTAQQADSLEKALPADAKAVPVDRCERGVDMAIADRLIAAWKAVLLQTRYSEGDGMGLDGTTYHFTLHQRGTFMAGQAWQPQPPSAPYMLVEISGAMAKYCRSGTPDALKKLDQKITGLTDMLSKNKN
jgi:hypothetical protein